MKMARRYVRDAEGRFAHTSGVGPGIVHVRGNGTFTGTNSKGEQKFFDNEDKAAKFADAAPAATDGIRVVEHKVPVMQRGLNYSVGHTTEKRYHVEGGPPGGFKNRAEAQRWQQRHNNPSASYSGFSTGHKAEPLRTDNRAAKVEEARLLAAAQARRAARNAAPTPPSSVSDWARTYETHGFSPVEAAKLAKKKVATDNPVSDDAKIAARKAAKAERARKRRAAAKGN